MTTERLTDEQIAELARQTARITSAPWRAEREPPPVGNQWFDGLPPHSFPVESTGTAFALGVAVAATPCRPEAEWIAAARNALPSLLAEVRAARASAPPDARPAPLPEHDPHRRFGPPDPRPTMLCPVHGEPLHSVWRCDKCPGMGVAASARPAPSAREEGPCDCACEAHPEGGCRCACDCRDAEGLRARVEAVVDEMDECADSSLDLSTEEWAERLRAALVAAPSSAPPDAAGLREAAALVVEEVRAIGQAWRDDWSDFDGRTLKSQLFAATEPLRAALAPASGSDTGAGAGAATPPENDWEVRPGSFDVRASCPKHPVAPMRRCGSLARCSECGDAVEVCDDVRGWKHCVRERGHAGLHVSPSGTSWPGAGDNTNREGP